jgi:hypothetical protein
MSQLTGAQKATLIDALLSGYTSDEQLAELLDLHLDVKLAEIAQDGTLREQVFLVVTWAESHGRTKELALQAQKFRPRNGALRAFVDEHYPGERIDPPEPPTPPSPGLAPHAEPSRAEPSPSAPSRTLIYGAAALAAILIVVVGVIAVRSWNRADNGRGDDGTGGGGAGKDRPRPAVALRFTELTGIASPERVVVDARFPPPQLAPGNVVWFVVGSGQRCRDRIHRAQVDNPSLGYMTSVIKAERARVTCAQLFVEDANGQAIARSDPREITFASR